MHDLDAAVLRAILRCVGRVVPGLRGSDAICLQPRRSAEALLEPMQHGKCTIRGQLEIVLIPERADRLAVGMPYDELAALLESSQDAARRNVFEGLKTLREEWTHE